MKQFFFPYYHYRHHHRRRRSNIFIYTKITASLPFIEIDLNLTPQQMSMFINGLKYIRPCQIQYARRSIDEILTEQYQNISTIVKQYLNDNIILQIRAELEQRIVRSIQDILRQRPYVVICRADKTKAVYCGDTTVMIAKALEYMARTKAYEEMTNGCCSLADILHVVNTLLDSIAQQKALTQGQVMRLRPNLKKLELVRYHGLPKTHKDGTPLRPIIVPINAPTTLISKFLNNLLAPIYLQVARDTTFINDIDVVRKLETYVSNGYLSSATKFITADVKDLYATVPREGAIEALIRFLEKYSYRAHTIDKKHGGAMGSAFTQVLANIYMLEWEQDLIQYQTIHQEIYGRYIDDIFMTTNQTVDEITNELTKAANRDVNIKIEYRIHTSIDFLDVTIMNENAQLRTSIYHKPTTEPYILPYTSDHPHHVQRNIPYAALLRTARLCSHVDDFNTERICIDMSLLLNHYPPKFITKHFQRFFQLNNAISVLDKLDENKYRQLHKKLLQQPTRREKNLQTLMEDPVENPEVLRIKIWNRTVMHLPYFDLGMKEGVWAPRVSKSFAKQHHTCRSYGFPKHVIEQRQKTITQQLQHTADELHWYLTNLEQNVQQWQPYIDPSVLSSAINECVKNAQQRLRQEFNYKRKMLTLNSNDRHLITKFYELQPNEEQIHIAKQIWQTTFDILKRKEQEEILRKRIFLRRLPTTYDKIIDKSLDYIEPMLSNQALDKDRRASLVSSYSKTITQYKFDLMALNLDTIQNVIRGHQQILNDLRNKLSQLCPELMIQAIENRQKFMQKRHQIYLKHKLHTFFDEAPATLNE
ncbi:unnamed protein product [Rotaria sp. Silwood2]|nr:unnamed protein product [Rotaria sp. Silwood2]